MKPAIFLDRDGVIIENRDNYVRAWEDVEFLPGALEALALLANTPYTIVVVTNQSAVGRGLITLAEAEQINTQLLDVILKGRGRIDAVYMCPHAPSAVCNCRKPKPGLITQAAEELNLDLSRSILIGDALTDLTAAQEAAVGNRILVLTGRGKDQLKLPEKAQLSDFQIYPTLKDVVNKLLIDC